MTAATAACHIHGKAPHSLCGGMVAPCLTAQRTARTNRSGMLNFRRNAAALNSRAKSSDGFPCLSPVSMRSSIARRAS